MTQTRKTQENRRLSTVDSKVSFWNGNGLTIKKKKNNNNKNKENQGGEVHIDKVLCLRTCTAEFVFGTL